MPNAPGSPYTIAQYHQWFKQNSLELAPPYQRKPIWALKNKCFLIDTILNSFPMPEIYMQVKTDTKGDMKYIVVDGQQRVRAILEFIEGEYSLLEEECPSYPDKEFKDLPDGVQREFWKYQIATRLLETDNENEVKNVFKRLNRYVFPLNHQELRNATYTGHFIALVNQIAERDTFWGENHIASPNDIKRMIDAEYISELFIAMMHGIQSKSQKEIDGFYRAYDQSFPDREERRKGFEAVEKRIEDILGNDLARTRWHQKVDFYSFFVAIYELGKEYYFPEERYHQIRECLTNFAHEVDKHVKFSEKIAKNVLVREYVESAEKRTTHKGTRQNRYETVRSLLIPFLIPRDARRDFSEEERRIAWNASPDKKCAICGQNVEWNEYQLDHIKPHSKGGKTELRNSRITHRTCNIKKSNTSSTEK